MTDEKVGNPGEAQRAAFLAMKSKADLAELLRVESRHLDILLWGSPLEERYKSFVIKKRSGGIRRIDSPLAPLRGYQSALAGHLLAVYRPRNATHGYVSDRSILTNARQHVARRYVLNVDLTDFFRTIHFGRVMGLFRSKGFEFSEDLSKTLAQLVCLNGGLAVGAPTSPILSNFICYRLDRELQQMSGRLGVRYTRYADDITFSTTRRNFPAALASTNADGAVVIGGRLQAAVESNGFSINPAKSRLRSRSSRQEVTGIVVNERANVPRRYIRMVRSMVFNWEQTDHDTCQLGMVDKYTKDRHPASSPKFAEVLIGRLSYIRQVRGDDDPVYQGLALRVQALCSADVNTPERLKKWKAPMVGLSNGSAVAARQAKQQVFVSYSRLDIEWLDKFKVHLSPVIRDGPLEIWDDSKIRPGDDFLQEIRRAIFESRIVVLLISQNFFASEFISREELPQILVDADSSGVRVLCLFVSASRFKREPLLNRFHGLNKPDEPLKSLAEFDLDETLQKAADEIEDLLRG